MCAEDIIANAKNAIASTHTPIPSPTMEEADTIVNAIVGTPDSKIYSDRKQLLYALAELPSSPSIAQAIREINTIATLENRLTFLYAMNTNKDYKNAIVDALMLLNGI